MRRFILCAVFLCLGFSLLTGCDFAVKTVSDSSLYTGFDSDITSGSTTTTAAEPSLQSTTSPSDTTASTTASVTEGMIFPQSDTELIRWDQLTALSLTDLAYARNDFFAREGYTFEKTQYVEHYQSLPWYKPDDHFSYDNFSRTQQANILLIQIAEARAGNGLLYLPSGSVLDFDQDGSLETLIYEMPDEETCNLAIGDDASTIQWKIKCECPYGKVYIGDINYDDGILDLFVDEMGASDDYLTYVAGVTAQGFLMRECVPGTCSDISLTGESVLTTKGRMKILMTWFSTVRYVLDKNGVLTLDRDSQYSMEDYPCTTLVDLPLRSSPDLSLGTDFTVPAGTQVFLVTTDDVEWVKVRSADAAGWVHITNFSNISDLNLLSPEVFDGLCIAD